MEDYYEKCSGFGARAGCEFCLLQNLVAVRIRLATQTPAPQGGYYLPSRAVTTTKNIEITAKLHGP